MTHHEVVITGTGAVSPVGIGPDFWNALMNQQSGIAVRDDFSDWNSPLRLAAAIPGFQGKDYIKKRKNLKLMCREIQIGCSAAMLAIDDSGLDLAETASDRIGVVVGTETFFCPPEDVLDSFTKYAMESSPDKLEIGKWIAHAMKQIQPIWMLKYLPNMVACQIGIAIDARGPNNSIVQGDASSLLAVQEAAELIRRGAADVMIVGGSGSQMNLVGMLYAGIDQLTPDVDDPARASRPFDKNRNGMVAGECAAMIVVESRQHAEKRGARIQAKLAGTSSHCTTAVCDMSQAIANSIQTALKKSDLTSVDHVYAAATGSVQTDSAEAKAIQAVLGETPVTALKSYIGNSGAGCGAIDIVAGVHSLINHCVPATLNYDTPDPECPVNVVHGSVLKAPQNSSLILGQSRTGQTAAVTLTSDLSE